MRRAEWKLGKGGYEKDQHAYTRRTVDYVVVHYLIFSQCGVQQKADS